MKNNFHFSSIAIMLFSILQYSAYAQTPHIDFTYDAAGNRIKREYFPFRMMGDTAKSDSVAQQIAAQYGIHVYPNPLMDGNNVTVVISNAKDKSGEDAAIYILDNTGKMLFSQKLNVTKSASGGQTTASPSQIDLSKYSAGVYYIKVMIGKEQLFYKVTKAK